MAEINKLKLKIVIDAEQYEGENQLSNWEYSEVVEYPYIENEGANELTLGLRKAVQDAIDIVVRAAATAKAQAESNYGTNPNGLIKSR